MPEDRLLGIDVSNHQGTIDWIAVAQLGVQFAIIKASEDADYRDPFVEANWQQARENDVIRGVYHFARPDQASPQASVGLLRSQIEAIGGLEVHDIVALDIEAGPDGDLSEWVSSWLSICKELLAVTPLLYSGDWFMRSHGLENPALGMWPLWYASAQTRPPAPPNGWDRITIWQNQSNGSVLGIDGRVDMNVFNGTYADLLMLGRR